MDAPATEQEAVRALFAMSDAIQYLHFYPISSTVTSRAVRLAFSRMQKRLETAPTFELARTEIGLRVGTADLPPDLCKSQKAAALRDILDRLTIRRLTFTKGLMELEFIGFLKMISDGFGALRTHGNGPKGHAGAGSETARTSEAPDGSEDSNDAPNIAGSRFSSIRIELDAPPEPPRPTAPGLEAATPEFRNEFQNALRLLERLLPPESQDVVSKHLAASMAQFDDQLLADILMQDAEGDLMRRFYRSMVAAMKAGGRPTPQAPENEPLRGDDNEAASGPAGRRHRMDWLVANIRNWLANPRAYRNRKVMVLVPKAIRWLFRHNRHEMAERFGDYLVDELVSEDPRVRELVSDGLAKVLQRISEEQADGMVRRISANLLEWLEMEDRADTAYQIICASLAKSARRSIRRSEIDAALPIIRAFNGVAYRRERKDGGCRRICRWMLGRIAGGDLLADLLARIRSDDPVKREAAVTLLKNLGAPVVGPLLDILKTSEDWYERARIMNILSEIGEPALPKVESELHHDRPWYYLRNIILLIGLFGNAGHGERIAPFLRHPDIRVRREALSAIYKIGGRARGDILLSALPGANADFRPNLIRALGRIRCKPAVSAFREMLSDEAVAPEGETPALKTAIRDALKRIDSPEATALLNEFYNGRPDDPGDILTLEEAPVPDGSIADA